MVHRPRPPANRDVRQPTTGRPRRSRRRVLIAAGIAAGLAAQTAVLGLTGGLATARGQVPEIRPGQTVSGTRFDIKPISARLITRKREIGEADRFVGLLADVRVHGRQTARITNELAYALLVRLLPQDARPKIIDQAILARDPHGFVDQLLPGLPERVTLLWKLEGPPPDRMEIVFHDLEYREGFLDPAKRWARVDEAVLGHMVLPVSGEGSQ